MPIINGIYVNDSLPGSKAAQLQVFGEHSRRDMSDYSSAAYNYLMKQQEQAYNLELWNLQNQYNSPSATMQRYMDAGLNPNLIYTQQNNAPSLAAASAPSFRSGGSMARSMQAGIAAIGQVMNTVRAAVDTFDYWKYGRQSSELSNIGFRKANELQDWRIRLLSSQESAQLLANDWNMYLQGRRDLDPNAPGVKMYRTQTEARSAQVDQIRQLIDASLTGQERTRALKALDDYRLQIMQGQNDAVLNIHTGLGDSFDGFLKAMVYLAMSKL